MRYRIINMVKPPVNIDGGTGEFPTIPLHERLNNVHDEFIYQILRPPRGDLIIGAFAEAAARESNNPDLVSLLTSALESRPDMDPEYTAVLFRNALQWQFLHRQVDGYPQEFYDPSRWQHEMRKLLEDKDGDEGGFACISKVMHEYNVSANRPSRYAGLKLPVLWGGGYSLDTKPSILDIGAGNNLGLKALASDPTKTFEPIEMVRRSEASLGDKDLVTLQNSLNRSLYFPWHLDDCYGLEITRHSSTFEEYVFSCSHTPTQLLDSEKVANYINLMRKDVPNVHLRNGVDCTDPRQIEHALPPGKQFDMVNISTLLYMLPLAKRRQILEQALKLVKPNGMIIVQDFADVDQTMTADENGNNFNLTFHSRIHADPYSYKTLAYYPFRSQEGFKELFIWENGSCQRAALGSGYNLPY